MSIESTIPSTTAGAPAHDGAGDNTKANRYVARILQQHLAEDPSARYWIGRGSAVFVDISGFTNLSERLARKGREGAEQIADAIGGSFESILQVAYDNGGSLLKFGGDALLLWFGIEGHVERACRAALLMRQVLRDVGRIEVPGAKVTLRMAQGIHSGEFHFFAVGTSHIELLPTGPGWSRLVAIEQAATAGEILLSSEMAALLPARCLGSSKGPGVLLRREPPGAVDKLPLRPRPPMPYETVAQCLSPAIRAHLHHGGGASEHRAVTVAFIRFERTDAMIESKGPEIAAAALHHLVGAVAAAADAHEVAFLGSDVDADGGKLILAAGAPKVMGDDEERMLLALRSIADADLPMPIRIGVHRGSVFAGDIGAVYRRTYTVMGDAVNLAARLMAQAAPGQIYGTGSTLDRSDTMFETTELPSISLKGKAQPVQAWAIGRAKGSRTRQASQDLLPLIGRDAEMAIIREAFVAARGAAGRLIEITGEAGAGKTRLMQALEEEAHDMRKQHAVCEAYTASKPYAVWSELLRELMEFGRDDPDAVVAQLLRETVAEKTPDLIAWLPLIGIAFGLEIAPTPEVEMLAEKNRRPKLHEVVDQFMGAMIAGPTLIEIENAHHMDGASAELLAYVCAQLGRRPWLIGVAQRDAGSRFAAPATPTVLRIKLEPLAANDALRMTQLATVEHPLPGHVLRVVAQRSGGNPQFLRDLLRVAIESGGVGGLPDSAEAAAMARIDALAPEDRHLVRRAAVFGLAFHPRMLSWVEEEADASPPGPAVWERLGEFFDEEPDGYLRFRRSLLRDTAYEGLPYKLRRRLHGMVATRFEKELERPEDAADILSLHYFVAGEYRPAWQYSSVAARRAQGAYAYVEAADMYSRALDAGRRLADVREQELATMSEALGDCWLQASEFDKASETYTAARRMNIDSDRLMDSRLLLKHSRVEEKLGRYPGALRWASRARKALDGRDDANALRQIARTSAWQATVLQLEGKSREAVRWAEQALTEARQVDDAEAQGAAHVVLGWACGVQGTAGAEENWQLALEAFQRSGNLARQPALLTNLGLACQWEGRWDEALAYYERGRDENLKIGNNVNSTIARLNIAEILVDRGEWIEAEALLRETLPFWQAARYRYFLGACLSLLARVSLRVGRVEEALHRFEDAKANFLKIGAADEIPSLDARIAECHLYAGTLDQALALATGMMSRTSSKTVAKLVPLLERVRSLALLGRGDIEGARGAATASLAAARTRKDRFESALTMLVQIEIDRTAGITPAPSLEQECHALLEQFKVRAVPALPSLAV
ncbi:MAG: adenylate/guanylate cyclase domain-containing protein [Betaproteobacteria bacterium]